MGVVSSCRLLKSGHDQVMVFLKISENVILCPDKKGQSPKAQRSPSKVPVLAKRRQISGGGSFRARFPHPAQLSSLRELGAQLNWPSVSSGPPKGGTRSHGLWPRQTASAIRLQRQVWGKGSPKAWTTASEGLSWGLWSPAGHSPSLFSGPSCSPAGPRLGQVKGLQEKA